MSEFKYETLTKAELTSLCDERDIDYRSADTKQDLIDKLLEIEGEETILEAAEEELVGGLSELLEDIENENVIKEAADELEDEESSEEKAVVKPRRNTQQNVSEDNYAVRRISGLKQVVKNSRDGIDRSLTNDSIEKLDAELAASRLDERHPVRGVVIGARKPRRYGNTIYSNILVSVGPYIVQIPSFQFWYDWRDEKKHPPKEIYKQASKMVGLEVDFNMISREGGIEGEILGTRLYSTLIARNDTWYAKMKDGSWYIEDGAIVKATVVRTTKYAVIVEYAGAEASIPIGQLGHFFTNTIIAEDYPPGKELLVRVTDIKREPRPTGKEELSRFDFPVSYKASVKGAEKNPQLVYFDQYAVGDTVPGVVANVYRNVNKDFQQYFVIVNNQITVCTRLGDKVGIGYMPEEGDKVIVRITAKDRDKHQVYGVIVSVRKRKKDIFDEYTFLDQ